MKIHIKNMVCARCIAAVEEILNRHQISYDEVALGEIKLTEILTKKDYSNLNNDLHKLGFEIIEDNKKLIVNQIKQTILEYLETPSPFKLSNYLVEKLHLNYNTLSSIFSTEENTTIEKYFIQLRIEKVKEHLSYNESLKEIAERFNFSSTAHLSKQFKDIVGISASSYKTLENKQRKQLDKI